jgi:3-hydroxymyristoyl/3-hydroxydecanoyl-(acyl carrier protein) dehydratase
MQEFDLDHRRISLPVTGNGFPRVLTLSGHASEAHLSLEITTDLNWFHGHFPDQPVLPGVIQLHWAVLVAQACFELSGIPAEVKRLKFKKIITPPKTLDLAVTLHAENEVQFGFDDAGAQYSEGRLVFSGETAC